MRTERFYENADGAAGPALRARRAPQSRADRASAPRLASGQRFGWRLPVGPASTPSTSPKPSPASSGSQATCIPTRSLPSMPGAPVTVCRTFGRRSRWMRHRRIGPSSMPTRCSASTWSTSVRGPRRSAFSTARRGSERRSADPLWAVAQGRRPDRRRATWNSTSASITVIPNGACAGSRISLKRRRRAASLSRKPAECRRTI